MELPTFDDVKDAADRLAGHAHRTPVLTQTRLDDDVGAEIHLKCENFQRIGAFKFRGAWNAMCRLDDEARGRGVVTHSSGNHGQAVALRKSNVAASKAAAGAAAVWEHPDSGSRQIILDVLAQAERLAVAVA